MLSTVGGITFCYMVRLGSLTSVGILFSASVFDAKKKITTLAILTETNKSDMIQRCLGTCIDNEMIKDKSNEHKFLLGSVL